MKPLNEFDPGIIWNCWMNSPLVYYETAEWIRPWYIMKLLNEFTPGILWNHWMNSPLVYYETAEWIRTRYIMKLLNEFAPDILWNHWMKPLNEFAPGIIWNCWMNSPQLWNSTDKDMIWIDTVRIMNLLIIKPWWVNSLAYGNCL
jgi:hypothetical protein